MRIHVPYAKAVMEAHKSVSVSKAKLLGCSNSDHIYRISSPIDIILKPVVFVPRESRNSAFTGIALALRESRYDVT